MASRTRNAAKGTRRKASTAPQATSCVDATKPWVDAKSILIGDEDPQQYESLRAGCLRDWAPQTTAERELVESIASLLWRMQRGAMYEARIAQEKVRLTDAESEEEKRVDYLAGLVERYKMLRPVGARSNSDPQNLAKQKPEPKPQPDLGAAYLFVREREKRDALCQLARHEMALMNRLDRAVNLLRSMQAARVSERSKDKPTAD